VKGGQTGASAARDERRWRRATAPAGLARIPWGYLAAFLALLVSLLFLLPLSIVQGPACGTGTGVGCRLGVAVILWGAGLLVGLAVTAWLLRLGWLFVLTYFAACAALFRFADSVQNVLTVVFALLIPAAASLSSMRWRTPWYRSWQAWLAVVVSLGVITWVMAWLLG
jgi:hypothetical protein